VPEALLQTKLYIPPLRPNLVSRPRLIERLNHGLQLGHKLTLISAPAGFGKTTLVLDWLSALTQNGIPRTNALRYTPSQMAWLSLDERDNDPARFLSYVIATLNQVESIEDTFGKGALGRFR
jgi:LuxR family maltose regulon positive regulatory protein